MKNKKQKIALLAVGVLLVVAVISGLVQPYLQNRNLDTIGPGRLQHDGKIPVPDFRFTDKEGNTVHLDDFKGKPVVINFWGTWCPYCVMEMDDFDLICGEYSDKVNFIFLDVPNGEDETPQKVDEFLADNGYTNIVSHFDTMGEGCYVFGLSSFPTTVYIDADGNLFDATIGMTNYDDIKLVVDSML